MADPDLRQRSVEFWHHELMVMLVIGISLMVSARLFGTSIMAGSIIGIYNYILKFVSGLDTIPIPFKG